MRVHSIQITISLFFIVYLCATSFSFAEEVVSDEIARLSEIHVSLTEGNKTKQKMVKRWLKNEPTGFPNLVKVLLNTVKCPSSGCNVKGPKLPLDVIEGWCRQNRSDTGAVIMNHTADEVKEAYIMTWYERNSHDTRDLTVEQILLGQ